MAVGRKGERRKVKGKRRKVKGQRVKVLRLVCSWQSSAGRID